MIHFQFFSKKNRGQISSFQNYINKIIRSTPKSPSFCTFDKKKNPVQAHYPFKKRKKLTRFNEKTIQKFLQKTRVFRVPFKNRVHFIKKRRPQVDRKWKFHSNFQKKTKVFITKGYPPDPLKILKICLKNYRARLPPINKENIRFLKTNSSKVFYAKPKNGKLSSAA